MSNSDYAKARQALISKMMEVLKYFISFCKDNNLVYWAGYGTAIGAVRHHAIIPWDDDIDILMPRDSYNRLLQLSEKFNNEQFEILHVKLNPNSTCRAIHVCDKKSTVVANINLPLVNGVHIGISPIDFSNDSDETIMKQAVETNSAFRKYFDCLFVYSFKDILKNLKSPRLLMHNMSRVLKNKSINKNKKELFRLKALEFDNYYTGEDGEKAFNIYELLFNKRLHIFKSEWFADSVIIPFEDISISLPIGYHEYLTMQYGDYMTPPPVNQQIPHHDIDYFNLKARLSFNEALERYSKGECYEY